MPAVQALVPVPDKDGNAKFYFAPYEEIMRQVRPLLVRHGFAVMFDSDFKEGKDAKDTRLAMRCKLMHKGGHSTTTTSMHRVGAVYGANDAQNDGATATFAKRYALCSALNIVVEKDTDGRTDSQAVTFEQAAYLKEMVKDTKSNEAAFLKYAGAGDYEHIPADRYDVLARELHKKKKDMGL